MNLLVHLGLTAFVLFLMYYTVRLRRKTRLVAYSAEHDPLTGLYNREGFLLHAESLLRTKAGEEPLAILFFNIKGFKVINELFGLAGGDKVLCETAALFENSGLRPLLLARFGADHFVILVRQADLNYDELVALCHRVYLRDSKQFHFYGRCGIYQITDKTLNVSGMCDRAKLAKESISDDFAKPYALFTESMCDGFVLKKELTSELTRALQNKELKVYYQPVFDAKTQKIVSAEALVRWEHPERGLLSPGVFIPIFEENGYISELDMFVGETSTDFLQRRLSQNKFAVPIAVNFSRMDFYDGALMDKLLANVESARLPAGFPRIEITESAYSALVLHNSKILNNIKKMGIKILLDDFGSGYSSFSSLRDFDFDIIKLDMGFVRQIEQSEKTRGIIYSMIEMAHHVGASVIAEGVETQQQAALLAQGGCDYFQGYFYGRPLPQAEFEALLDGAMSL